jgi:hypothetical protein
MSGAYNTLRTVVFGTPTQCCHSSAFPPTISGLPLFHFIRVFMQYGYRASVAYIGDYGLLFQE